MASAPRPNLPLFYKDLLPLNSREHGNFKSRKTDRATWIAGQHAIPLTVDEFVTAQRHFPIIFSSDENPVPLALMGLNEGVNAFFDEEGKLREHNGNVYLPAYARRYPFLLARIQQDSDQMTLCFDPTSHIVGEFDEGDALFEGDQPTKAAQDVMEFCQRFEEAGRMTQQFIEELKKHELLMDGEVSIQRDGEPTPYIYRGFKMINQEKLREMRGDQLRTWNQNGILPLIFCHLMSLDLMRVIFARQVELGKVPTQAPMASNSVN
jgi:hypothetical protein